MAIEVAEESVDWLTVYVSVNQGFHKSLGGDAGRF
jgi:hypothetical protein